MKRKFIYGGFVIALFSTIGFAQQPNRTVTNQDLNKFRERRIQAEAEYNKKVESGAQPSQTDIERRNAERLQFNRELTEKSKAKQQQTENAFQSQAFALKSELAALDAEINFVRARVNEIPEPQTYYAVGYLPYGGFGYNGFGGVGFGGVGFPQYPNNANANIRIGNNNIVLSGNQTNVQQNGSVAITTANNLQAPQLSLNQNGGFTAGSFPTNNFGGALTNLNFGGAPYTAGILAAPFTLPTPQNLTREELLARLRALRQTRAGLQARFDVLQEEARRNGVNVD